MDEEQKFGVNIKEKIKNLRTEVDTLTLSATPIPRTLQFSLMAVRNLSLINTPPPNRYPVDTRVIRFDPKRIREAVMYEITRGGQVFFVHNRVENIGEVADMLRRLLPEIKIGVGHGKMDGKSLEKLMMSFIRHEFDLLLSTTIIESGLDVPNANTIFINDAQKFGLSDLHQMRGRVGRSNKKAFCYMITPPLSTMNEDARKRIQAIQTFTALGSGFQIAMKDLEIRGAGDLLGAEQSGFINDLGFETYQRILREAVEELKENEFKSLYKEEKPALQSRDIGFETDSEIFIPDSYIPSIEERLNIYRRMGEITNEEELNRLMDELRDRFGEWPEPVSELAEVIRLKQLASQLGWEKITLKNKRLSAYFPPEENTAYYNSPVFQSILTYLQRHPNTCRLIEKKSGNEKKLILRFSDIANVRQALEMLRKIRE